MIVMFSLKVIEVARSKRAEGICVIGFIIAVLAYLGILSWQPSLIQIESTDSIVESNHLILLTPTHC